MRLKRAAVIIAVILPVVLGTTPAIAHSTIYCGHATSGTYHRQAFVYAWTDKHGRHRHLVQRNHLFGKTPWYINPVCPKH